MKFIFLIIIFLFLTNCSFDNKSGIWKNDTIVSNEQNEIFRGFEKISQLDSSFNKEIKFDKTYKFKINKPITTLQWTDNYFDETNNFKNFKYNDSNQLIFKSKKITKYEISKHLFFINNNIIISDEKGNINIFSLTNNKLIDQFNFYKKKYKKFKKKLNLAVKENIIYISDNIGYLYAYDFNKRKILWAKNFNIPFRSNIKVYLNKLLVANQNNDMYFINISNGEILKKIPTEETKINNKFVNNLSIKDDIAFFLNTYGSLYALDNNTMNIIWFMNLNQSLDLNPGNLFFSNQVINYKNKTIVSSNKYLHILNSSNGSTIFKKNFTSLVKPLIVEDYLFLISKNFLLISLDLNSGKILYSYDINKKLAKFLNTKKKQIAVKNIMMVNGELFIFLKNSYLLKFSVQGELKNIFKLPNKLNSNPIFVNNSLFYVDKNKKISEIN